MAPGTPFLPTDLWADILLRIPAEHLVKIALVCKSWHDLIWRSQSFAQSHLEYQRSHGRGLAVARRNEIISYFCIDAHRDGEAQLAKGVKLASAQLLDFPMKGRCMDADEEEARSTNWHVLGSCDGLLLLLLRVFNRWHQQLFIYNPVTGSHDKLPRNQRMDMIADSYPDKDYAYDHLNYEWAFVRDNNALLSVGRYKVYGISKEEPYWWARKWTCFWYVFELQKGGYHRNGKEEKSLEWNMLEVPLEVVQFPPPSWRIEAATSTATKVHWLARGRGSRLIAPEAAAAAGRAPSLYFFPVRRLLSLDISNHEFRASTCIKEPTPAPGSNCCSSWNGSFYHLQVWEGWGGHDFELWELENLGDDLPKWTMRVDARCSIPELRETTGRFVMLEEAKLIIQFEYEKDEHAKKFMYVYDAVSKEWGKVDHLDIMRDLRRCSMHVAHIRVGKFVPHFNSLLAW